MSVCEKTGHAGTTVSAVPLHKSDKNRHAVTSISCKCKAEIRKKGNEKKA